MSTLPLLNYSALDADGDSIPGAKLYFYESGGSVTPLDTYSDEDLSVANANPVVADANGRFDRIFLKTDDEYRVVFTDASDVTIWTEDNVRATQLTGAGLDATLQKVASNPLTYGAVGDGAADESGEVQSAIDNATGTVDLLGLTFRCDSAISLDSGVTLRNGTLDFTNCPDDEYVKAEGSLGSGVLLTSDASAGDETIDVASVSGLTAGDWLLLYATDSFGGGSDAVGEIVKIKSISSLTITLVDPLMDDYTTANTGTIKKLSTLSMITVRDVQITCAVGASGAGRALYFDACEGVSVHNVRVNTPKATGIEMRRCVNSSVFASTVMGAAVTGVGFELGAASRNVVAEACQSYLLDTGFRIGQVDSEDGVTRMVTILNCVAAGCGSDGFKVAVNAEYNTVGGLATTISGASAITDSGSNTRNFGVQDINPVGTSDGLAVSGAGAGSGVSATGGGSNGAGVTGTGGSTNGWGGVFTAATGGSGTGVSGTATGSGNAVSATNTGTGTGLIATTSGGSGLGALFVGNTTRAAIRLMPQSQPSTGQVGDIYVTAAGIPYVCTVAGTPGTWTKVSAT